MEPNQEPTQPIQPVGQKQKNSWKMPLIITAIAIIAAGLASGTTWFLMNQSQTSLKADNDKSVAALQQQINDLKKTQTVATTSTTTDWHMYKNTDYGFQLTFGDKWKGYTSEKTVGVPSKNALVNYSFSLPTNDPSYTRYGYNPSGVFGITVYNTKDYQDLVALDTQGTAHPPILIQTKDGKSFTYSVAQQWPNDWSLVGGNNGDVQTVISTFKFN